MTPKELLELTGNDNPVLCTDGKFGMLLIRDCSNGLAGVQVHGEQEHRWISSACLTASSGGALRQINSPIKPPAATEILQAMLAMDWVARGGFTL